MGTVRKRSPSSFQAYISKEGSRKVAFLFSGTRGENDMAQKLTEYLKSIDDPLSSFIYIANANCRAFRRQSEGKGNEEDYEEMTFFRTCVQNLLSNSMAMSLLEDTEIIMINQEPGHSGMALYYILVDYPEERFPETKTKIQELLI